MSSPTAVISDIHSNFEALTAVLADIKSQEISQIVCLGDIVGYASGVRACLRAIQELGCPVVQGNHDEAACLPEPPMDFNDTARAGVAFAAERLTESDCAWLSSLPLRLDLEGVSFTHASLAVPFWWEYVLSVDGAARHFAGQPARLAFCGHTHKPMVWLQEVPRARISLSKGEGTIALPKTGKILVNVGSVGQPRDGDNRACYAIYRPDADTIEFRRVPYDIKRTKKRILRAGLPRFTALRLFLGR